MLKKLTLAVAIVLILALTMPALSLSLTDVPADHWAYSAIEELIESGIVEGYPDGEYKGQRTMNRYEMAIMVNRALDKIAAEQEELAEGLKMGQAEDTAAIVQSLLEKNLGQGLTYEQASEVADLVEALTAEFEEELAVIGADLDLISEDLAALQREVNALDLPEDNLEFSLDIATYFEAAAYDDDELERILAAFIWADEDVLDIDDINDIDELPSKKRFWQELDFVINAEIGDAAFKLEMDTLTNVFTQEKSAFDYQEEDQPDFKMDQALLTFDYREVQLRMGDFEDYNIARYFVDEEDLQGVELSTNQLDMDLKFLVAGYGDDSDFDVFAIEGRSETDYGVLTTKINQVRRDADTWNIELIDFYFDTIFVDFVVPAERLTNVSLAIDDYYFNDNLLFGGEYVYNEYKYGDESQDDYLLNFYADLFASDQLKLSAVYESVGDEFFAYQHDLEAALAYDLYKIGAAYDFNENSSVIGSYTLVKPGSIWDDWFGDDLTAEDKDKYEIVFENDMNGFNNSAKVEVVKNELFFDNFDERTVTLKTAYDWNEKTTLGAKFVNKNISWAGEVNDDGTLREIDLDLDYKYLEAFMEKALRENLSWNITGRYIMGDVEYTDSVGFEFIDGQTYNSFDLDTKSSMIKTGLIISF
ncbi:S-layer homology domain-containing protein [Halanaerobium hydrogeniformans]|uniref:S-layer domain-containing protein n=1 Tax=Halanaerobium hydrogeniformans TaxID=656519 RepID=E4RPN3_HALHG|nr:S-layer homology domain-containing protein [Halanaerobium hydrogeniformans]ADQ13917.1 S-layer domain-containing protein [Halanaerobium hydrogeniformans]